ncbi:uncharacterized protein LOC143205223 [Rhynchophorus ferrugineus]|uniref:uncharacterized protein LOC143205223 n=1 Tax=Rhynchophorus ferrugineus TaxID=354439 RepID=UPI003FCD5DD4
MLAPVWLVPFILAANLLSLALMTLVVLGDSVVVSWLGSWSAMAPQGWWFVRVAPLVGCTSAAWPLFNRLPVVAPRLVGRSLRSSWLTERSLCPPQIDGQLWAARCGPSRLKERSLWTPDWWAARCGPPSGWWAVHCGPSMLKERSLWPPDWWAARCGPPSGWWAAHCGFLELTSHLLCDRQVGGKQVAGPLKSLHDDCRPQVGGMHVAGPSKKLHADCGPQVGGTLVW